MRIKRTVLMLLSCLLIVATLPMNVFAADGKYSSKDEVIYGKLDSNGNVKNMYVVNSFAVSKAGEFIDYGTYNSVRNLTDLSTIEQEGNKVEFDAVSDFYYQGELENKTLPWDIAITYMLDGKEVDPENLAGESGDFEIQIETTANEDVDQTFFEYYMLQIAVTFDPSIFKSIQAPEATEANEGKNKLLNFSILPEQEEVFIISAQVTDLEMDPIDISAVPASIGFDDPDTEDLAADMQELADAMKDINQGVGDLSTGVSDLRGGAASLSEGSAAFQSGLTELNNSSGELINGSQQILTAFRDISGQMADAPEIPDLGEVQAIPQGLRDAATAIRGLNEGATGLEDAFAAIPDGTIEQEQINEIKEILNQNSNSEENGTDESETDEDETDKNAADESETDEGETDENESTEDQTNNDDLIHVIKELEEAYYAAQAAKELSKEVLGGIKGANEEIATNLEEIADGIEAAMGELTVLDDIAELQEGLTTMASEYETFHKGLITYTNGVSKLATNYNELNNGTIDLSNGISELENGVITLHDGTKKLQDSTSDLPEQFQSEIDSFMDEFDFSDYEPVSFVSDKNENVSVVQFVLETESIKKEEVEDEPEEKEESKNLWNRFLDLFR